MPNQYLEDLALYIFLGEYLNPGTKDTNICIFSHFTVTKNQLKVRVSSEMVEFLQSNLESSIGFNSHFIFQVQPCYDSRLLIFVGLAYGYTIVNCRESAEYSGSISIFNRPDVKCFIDQYLTTKGYPKDIIRVQYFVPRTKHVGVRISFAISSKMATKTNREVFLTSLLGMLEILEPYVKSSFHGAISPVGSDKELIFYNLDDYKTKKASFKKLPVDVYYLVFFGCFDCDLED